MLDKINSFYVFEYLDESPLVADVLEKLASRPYVDIQKNEYESSYCFVGPDHFTDPARFLSNPAGMVSFSLMYQFRKINPKLVKREYELKIATEYFGEKLSRDDIKTIKEVVTQSLMDKFPIVTRFVDVIMDLTKNRIYLRACGDTNLFRAVNRIAGLLEIKDISLRPWFSGDFIERVGSWEHAQIIFIHWLNGVCNDPLNPYNINAGTKISMKDNGSKVNISGDCAKFNTLWDQFGEGRKIDSCQVILNEKRKENKEEKEIIEEVLRYQINYKKFAFSEVRSESFYSPQDPTSETVLNQARHLDDFIKHFDSLCIAFQTKMQSHDLSEVYKRIVKWQDQ